MSKIHFRILRLVVGVTLALTLVALSGRGALAAGIKVSAQEIQQYWRQALAKRTDRDLIYRRMLTAGLIPSASAPAITLSDDPPNGPGVPPPPPGGGDDSEFTPSNPEPVPDPQKPDAAHLRITVKSYIATIGKAVGVFANQRRANAFAWLTDLLWSENPLTDAMIKDYRLFTQTDAIVVCNNGLLTSWQFSKLISDTGREPPPGPLQAPKGFIRGARFARLNASTISFEWYFYGKPNPKAEAGIQLVQARTSVFIWHHINGTIACKAGQPPIVKAVLTGSAFPTHRWWLNNVIQATVPQGLMSGLWVPIAPGSNVVK